MFKKINLSNANINLLMNTATCLAIGHMTYRYFSLNHEENKLIKYEYELKNEIYPKMNKLNKIEHIYKVNEYRLNGLYDKDGMIFLNKK
jgi:uncharacterized protein YifN (PemK superfamily)